MADFDIIKQLSKVKANNRGDELHVNLIEFKGGIALQTVKVAPNGFSKSGLFIKDAEVAKKVIAGLTKGVPALEKASGGNGSTRKRTKR